jgi:hypothetical protein
MADLTLNEYTGLENKEVKIRLLEEYEIILHSNHSNEPATRLAVKKDETRSFKKIRHLISRYFKPIPFKKVPV